MLKFSDVKELSKVICQNCDEIDYNKCKSCKLHQLINSIFS